MDKNIALRLMKLSLSSLALYFLLIALAHITSTKVPLLFVYFNVPSHAYQDNIIAFMAFGWAVFFFTASRDPQGNLPLVRGVLIAAAGALAILSYTNLTTDFATLAPQAPIWPFWAQTAVLAAISAWLLVLYRKIRI